MRVTAAGRRNFGLLHTNTSVQANSFQFTESLLLYDYRQFTFVSGLAKFQSSLLAMISLQKGEKLAPGFIYIRPFAYKEAQYQRAARYQIRFI